MHIHPSVCSIYLVRDMHSSTGHRLVYLVIRSEHHPTAITCPSVSVVAGYEVSDRPL